MKDYSKCAFIINCFMPRCKFGENHFGVAHFILLKSVKFLRKRTKKIMKIKFSIKNKELPCLKISSKDNVFPPVSITFENIKN